MPSASQTGLSGGQPAAAGTAPDGSTDSHATIGKSVTTGSPTSSPEAGTSSPTAGARPAPASASHPATGGTGPIPVPQNTVVVPSFDPAPSGLILPASDPVSLSIPAIGVASAILDLGLLPDGTIQTPPLDDPVSKAGWYAGSPTPGSEGPSILLGHVDTKKYGPGVFYNLGRLKPGDTVDITRADHMVAVFRVDSVRSFPKAQFPTHEVYGNIDTAGLRLITCGGVFDPSKSSYESNIIAFASLVSSRKA